MPEYDRHHLVPQFYLKNFAQKRKSKHPQLETIDINRDKSYPVNVINAAVKTGFYDLDVISFENGLMRSQPEEREPFLFSEGEFKKSTVETLIGGYEAAAGHVLSKIINYKSWPLSPEDRYTLSTFLALQNIRGQKFADTMTIIFEEFKKELLSSSKSEFYENHKDAPKTALDDFWSKKDTPEAFTIPVGNILMVSLLSQVPTLANEISSRFWHLVTSPEPKFFTSDEPLSLSEYCSSALKDSEFLIFPVNRNMFILMENINFLDLKEKDERIKKKIVSGIFDRIDVSSDKVFDFFEFHVIANAHEYIFLHPEHDKKRVLEKLRYINSLKRV